MKKRRNRLSRASALQVSLSFCLLSFIAILLVSAAPSNTEKPPRQDSYRLQIVESADPDSITALGNYPNTSIPLSTNTVPPTATPTVTTPASPTPTATAIATGIATGHPTPTPTPCGTTGPGDAGGGQTGADLQLMSGNVSYCSNPVPAPVPGVTILLNNQPNTTTNSSGDYFIVFKKGCNCRVRPSQADRTPGSPGINTVDVLAVQQHFLIIGPPLSGCRLTAADVNGDASIDTIDVLAIQRFFLGLSTGIANVGKYQFNPSSRCFVAQPNQNFDTLIFGDVEAPFIY